VACDGRGAGTCDATVECAMFGEHGTMSAFSDVEGMPAYLSAAYEPRGTWDSESGPPPSGTSVGMFSKTPPKPEPIDAAAGKSVTVKISFDDTTRLP
jgi:hypothetical protein